MQSSAPSVAVISTSQPANCILRIHLRANSDPASDSQADFHVTPETTAADIQAWVAQEKAKVAAQYAGASLARQTLLDAIE